MKVRKQLVTAIGIAVALAALTAGAVGFASEIRTVAMNDQCDPKSFNAVFGDGTCANNGGVSVNTFLAELTHSQKAGAWSFTPDPLRMREGQAVQAVNTGGEAHTFTEVEEFGGGFFPELNVFLEGNPEPTPECAEIGKRFFGGDASDLILPGGKSDPDFEDPGVIHYQCCIHPWMRTNVIVR
jgi:plastocyanin